MKVGDAVEAAVVGGREETAAGDPPRTLQEVRRSRAAPAPNRPGITVGDLIALKDGGRTPLVRFAGQHGTAAVPARTTVDLHGAHIGRPVVLMFEEGDAARPIVMGVLREGDGWPMERPPGQVEVEADGERLVVSAREQLVLRCGKASITLTRAGKVIIRGEHLLSRSAGVNRIKGGSVQIN